MEHLILSQSYDGNPAMSLPLCNYPFGQKYVERCEATLKFLIGVVKERIELVRQKLANELSFGKRAVDQTTAELEGKQVSQA